MGSSFRRLTLAGALLSLVPSAPLAHEVPARVTALVLVKPEGHRLRLLARIPLESVRDVQFPLRGAGFLDLAGADPLLRDAATLWIANYVEVFETGAGGSKQLDGEQVVAARVSLPSDRSFAAYESALAHVLGSRLSEQTELPWQQAMLDVLIEYPIGSDQSAFSIRAALAHLGIRTTTVLRFFPPGGSERVFQWTGNPGLVRLDPSWYQAGWRFLVQGFQHIFEGIDHLLFVLCLVIPFRRFRSLVAIVTSFTVAHSITLFAAALGFAPRALWFPPLIETLIALSIVFMAFENIAGPRVERRWLIAFAFGIVHGFGFSFALRESLQFAGTHLLLSLASFNVGVELGQLAVLVVAIPVLDWLFKRVIAERVGTILLSALVAHSAWHWTTERGGDLLKYELEWPAFDSAFAVSAMRTLMVAGIALGALWLLRMIFGGDGVKRRVSERAAGDAVPLASLDS